MKSRFSFLFALFVSIFPIVLSCAQSPVAATAATDALNLAAKNQPIPELTPFPFNGPGAFNPADAHQRQTNNLPTVYAPSVRIPATRYKWKREIITTVFWVGETPTKNNPTPNTKSSWDPRWTRNFGGYDDPRPNNRKGWLPRKFVPKQNPFYFALPYNDTSKMKTKDTARQCIPWFKQQYYRDGRSVLKGRWLAIQCGDLTCYGQWEDCGPFETDNWEYVFGEERPRTKGNGGAGLDVSPAIRDYLGFKTRAICDWRFVELHEVPDGPWKNWGHNNPFALHSMDKSDQPSTKYGSYPTKTAR